MKPGWQLLRWPIKKDDDALNKKGRKRNREKWKNWRYSVEVDSAGLPDS